MVSSIKNGYKRQMTDSTEKYESPAQKVIAFFSNELAVPPEGINMTSRLRQDLKMNGIDAVNILEAYALTFDVDIGNFRTNDYFGTEKEIHPVLGWMFWIFGNARPLKTLTIADLVRAFEAGKLG